MDIREFAEIVGVSHGTVTNAFNGRGRIAKETRERVLAMADKLGYRPNAIAKALATNRTNNIGLVVYTVQEMVGPHFGTVVEAIEPLAREKGYRLLVSSQLDALLDSSSVDGFIVFTAPSVYENEPRLQGRKYVHIHGGSASGKSIVPGSIMWDDELGAYKAVKCLAELGHKNVVSVLGDIPEGWVLPKVSGSRRAASEFGLEYAEYSGMLSTEQTENGYLLGKKLLEEQSVTAVFARNDQIAAGVMRAIREAGKRIPEDISVIGYNDTPLAKSADPPLTSVHTPIAQAGELGLEMLIQSIEKDGPKAEGIVLETSITYRATCASPSKI